MEIQTCHPVSRYNTLGVPGVSETLRRGLVYAAHPLEGHSNRLNVVWTDSYVECHCRQTESAALINTWVDAYLLHALSTWQSVRRGSLGNVEERRRETLTFPCQCVAGMQSAETESWNLQALVWVVKHIRGDWVVVKVTWVDVECNTWWQRLFW